MRSTIPVCGPATIALPTKFCRPSARSYRVDRRVLLAKLDSAQAKTTMIVAPAGTGKTTLLVQWARARDRNAGWMTLNHEDNQLAAFLASLLMLLAETAPELSERIDDQLALIDAMDISTVAMTILNQVTRSVVPWSLVLDDYHHITDPEVHAFINELMAAMPDDCRLIIASRAEPPLPIARLRVLEELTILSANDLRATMAESEELLDGYGVRATDAQLTAISELTAGWMAAVHLVALASRDASLDRVINALGSFDGQMDLLGDYLFDEVLCQQTPELRAFLLQISIVDRFTPDSCYAVTGNAMSSSLLDQARRGGLFLAELDESGTWLTFQNPFRDFLRNRLPLEYSTDDVKQLHVAASRWYQQRNFTNEAIKHAVRGEDWDAASNIISPIAADLLRSHRIGELERWVRTFPHDTVQASPNLSSIAAFSVVRQGRLNDSGPYLAAAERQWEARNLTAGLAILCIIRGAIGRFRDDASALIENSARGIELMTGERALDANGQVLDIKPRFIRYSGTWLESTPQIVPYQHLFLGLALQGRFREAAPLHSGIEDALLRSGLAMALPDVLIGRATLHVAHGRLEMAVAAGDEFARHMHDTAPNEMAKGILSVAGALYELDRLDQLDELLQTGIKALVDAGISVQLPDLYIQRARIQLARGDVPAALLLLNSAEPVAASLQNLKRRHDVDALRAGIAIAAGDIPRVQHWAMTRSFTADMNPDSTTLHELDVYARLLIAQDESEAAVRLLQSVRDTAERNENTHDLIAILVWMSMAYLDRFELDQAVATLAEALTIGETGGYQRVFLDEGAPMLRLLRIAHRRGLAVNYIRELLLAAGETPGQVVRLTHRELVEPITAREIEVLGLVTLGLTNKEISDELYLSVATVKRHITNLYGKLGVSSRTEAVQRARRLGLLSSEHASKTANASETDGHASSNGLDVTLQMHHKK